VGIDKSGLLRGESNRVSIDTGTWLEALFESLVTHSLSLCRRRRSEGGAPTDQERQAQDRPDRRKPEQILHRGRGEAGQHGRRPRRQTLN